jgi:hypothetical protein
MNKVTTYIYPLNTRPYMQSNLRHLNGMLCYAFCNSVCVCSSTALLYYCCCTYLYLCINVCGSRRTVPLHTSRMNVSSSMFFFFFFFFLHKIIVAVMQGERKNDSTHITPTVYRLIPKAVNL